MSQPNRPTLLILTIVFILVTLVNAAAQFAIFTGGPGDPTGQVPESQEADTPSNELEEDIGGMTQVTSIPVGIITAIMAVVSVGLLMNRGWAITGAVITLGIDIVLKIINILVEITAGPTLADLLPAVGMIVVEGVLLYFFNRQRQMLKAPEQPMSPGRVSSQS